MQSTPQPRVENDLTTLRSACRQAQASMMVPTYAKESLAASLRVIESHEREIQSLRDYQLRLRADLAKLRADVHDALKAVPREMKGGA